MEAWRDELYHHGIRGQKWGVRRYQNPDGTLTDAGRRRLERKINKTLSYNERKAVELARNTKEWDDFINNSQIRKNQQNAIRKEREEWYRLEQEGEEKFWKNKRKSLPLSQMEIYDADAQEYGREYASKTLATKGRHLTEEVRKYDSMWDDEVRKWVADTFPGAKAYLSTAIFEDDYLVDD